MNRRSVADIEGPWVDPDWDSGLINRCRRSWSTPIDELSNEMLGTFLRQDIATNAILEEAQKRLDLGFNDDTEWFEGQLAEAVRETRERLNKR